MTAQNKSNVDNLRELSTEIREMLDTVARVKGEAYRHALLACFNAHTCMMLAVGVIETGDPEQTDRARAFVATTMLTVNASLMGSFSIAIYPDNKSMSAAEIEHIETKRDNFTESLIKDLDGLLTKNMQYVDKGI